jgi:hypothetical protein
MLYWSVGQSRLRLQKNVAFVSQAWAIYGCSQLQIACFHGSKKSMKMSVTRQARRCKSSEFIDLVLENNLRPNAFGQTAVKVLSDHDQMQYVISRISCFLLAQSPLARYLIRGLQRGVAFRRCSIGVIPQ